MTASTSQADELTYFLLRFHLGLWSESPHISHTCG